MASSRELSRQMCRSDDETQEYHLLLTKTASPGNTRSIARKSLRPSGEMAASQGTARRPRPIEHLPAISRDKVIIIDDDDDVPRSLVRRTEGQRAASLKAKKHPTSFSDDVLYIQPQEKDCMFAWEHVGLGLEYDVSSGTTSDEHEPSTITGKQCKMNAPIVHTDPEAVANFAPTSYAASGTAPSFDTDSPKPPRGMGDGLVAPAPNRAWVRNLIELRRDLLRERSGNHDLARRPESRQWLREQHRALEEGAILVTLKCVLAASGVSKLFTACAVDFMRPEYTTRYWKWSQNFVRLVDHTIAHGNTDILRRPFNAPRSLIDFVRTSMAQRGEGRLSPHKEALLSALGIRWSDSPTQSQGPGNTNNSDSSSQGMQLRRQDTRRRYQQNDASDINSAGSRYAQPILSEMFVAPDCHVLEKWAWQFVELRRYFCPGRGYEIPSNMPYLRIWMNAEAARSSTGTLCIECCGILRAARIIDATNAIRIPRDCYRWCRGFIDFVDYIISAKSKLKGKAFRPPSLRLTNYIIECFNEKCDRLLSKTRDGLLSGAQPNWFASKVVQKCVKGGKSQLSASLKKGAGKNPNGNEKVRKRSVTKQKGHGQKRMYERGESDIERDTEKAIEKDIGNDFEKGFEKDIEIVEVEDNSQKRRKSNVCDRMVSSMIKGMVAETTGGRSRTTDEVDAEAWVEEAGLEALNKYAQNWFRSFDE